MAGGMTYTAAESTQFATAEIYGKALCELGEKHPEVVALTADLGKSTKIGLFGEKFPDRFFNVGIAEQNMFGMAAGMAKQGMIPVFAVYSTFLPPSRYSLLSEAPTSSTPTSAIRMSTLR